LIFVQPTTISETADCCQSLNAKNHAKKAISIKIISQSLHAQNVFFWYKIDAIRMHDNPEIVK